MSSSKPSSSSSFGDWFDKHGAQASQHLSGAAAQPAAPASGATSFLGLFGAAPSSSSSSANDVESGDSSGAGGANSETASFLPSFVRNTGLFGPTQPQPSEWACGMSMTQRIQVGVLVLIASGFLFMTSLFVFLPMAVLAPSKFATAFTIASLLFMFAMAMFRGPRTTLMGFLDKSKLPFALAYFGSLVLTLYATLVSGSYLTIILAVVVQFGALLWYVSSFVAGGTTAASFITRMAFSSAASSARGVAGLVVGGR